ncbi:unnamed protein product [Moneuplotes crassus]|uniref:Uncharacterized protein n=1 Tax=Euplotes crassus TaxID=5936 RepID=A0AAD1XUT6_EUPCR|nr:unnamed protein product [Moneuplotes crassus]
MGCGCSSNIQASLPESGKKYLSKITGFPEENLQNGIVILDMTQDDDHIVLKKLSQIKIPKFGAIKIRKIIREDLQLINQVAVHSIESNLYIFSLQAVESRVPLDSKPLLKLAKNVTQRMTLRNFKMEKSYIAKLIEASFQAGKVSFLNCLFTGECSFDIRTSVNFRIETLCFHNKDEKEKLPLEDIKALVLKMKDTLLIESLRTLSVRSSDDRESIRTVLKENGFQKVDVEDESESE